MAHTPELPRQPGSTVAARAVEADRKASTSVKVGQALPPANLFVSAPTARPCRYLGTCPPFAHHASRYLLVVFGFALWQGACHSQPQIAMLKITLHDSAREFRLKLEGRLSGLWVHELEQCWKTARSTTEGRKTVLDLGEVDFVDPAAESLLSQMHSAGVELVA